MALSGKIYIYRGYGRDHGIAYTIDGKYIYNGYGRDHGIAFTAA